MNLVKIYLFDKCAVEVSPCIRPKVNIPIEFKYVTDGALAKCLLVNYAQNIAK
jgi:hypothetical protein